MRNLGKQKEENGDLIYTYRKFEIPATHRSLKATRKEMKGKGKERNGENFITKRLHFGRF